jgi:hypothetical protein
MRYRLLASLDYNRNRAQPLPSFVAAAQALRGARGPVLGFNQSRLPHHTRVRDPPRGNPAGQRRQPRRGIPLSADNRDGDHGFKKRIDGKPWSPITAGATSLSLPGGFMKRGLAQFVVCDRTWLGTSSRLRCAEVLRCSFPNPGIPQSRCWLKFRSSIDRLGKASKHCRPVC